MKTYHRWIHKDNGVYEALNMCRRFFPWRVFGYSRMAASLPVTQITPPAPPTAPPIVEPIPIQEPLK